MKHITLFFMLFSLSEVSYSNPKGLNLATFNRLMVLDNGRIKPMETYANSILLQFSGRRSINGISASEWLAEVFFTPDITMNDPVFLINNPETLDALHLERGNQRRFSFNQLKNSFTTLSVLANQAHNIEEKNRSPI